MIKTIEDVISLSEEWKDEWNRIEFLSKSNHVVLFGAGSTSDYILKKFRNHNVNPVAFCDNQITKQGTMINGKFVLSLDSTINSYPDAYYYITTQLFYTDIYDQLIAAGISDGKIIVYDLICQFEWEENYREYLIENISEIKKVLNRLEDELSVQVLLMRLAFLITRRREYVMSVRSKNQYFESFINYKEFDYFIDVGTYTGDTILDFDKAANNDKYKVIGFEMDSELYGVAEKNLSFLGNRLNLIKKAVSCKDGELFLNSTMGVMQSVSDNTFFNNQKSNAELKKFSCCKLDTVLDFKGIKDKTVFLKMDIEGAEMDALEGAKKTISENHPFMAICVYHKKDDIWNIAEYIEQCFSDYKFFLRHYSDNQTETVLYSVPRKLLHK